MDPIVRPILDKILEQIDLTLLLLPMLPPGAESWRPPVPGRPMRTAGELAAHLADCAAGFLAVLLRLRPRELAHLERWRTEPPPAGAAETAERLGAWREEIVRGFTLLKHDDLISVTPTVFVPAGEPALTLLLGNLEHLVNHKQQWFLYLRLLGVDAGTAELYRLRGA